MNKAELVTIVAEKTNQSRKVVAEIIDEFFDASSEELIKGNDVMIAGFGTFEVKNRKERVGTSPLGEHEKITIPASKSVGFTVSRTLRAKIREN